MVEGFVHCEFVEREKDKERERERERVRAKYLLQCGIRGGD